MSKAADIPFSVRIPGPLKKRIENAAERRFQTTSDLVRELLTRGLEKIDTRKSRGREPVGAK